MTSSASTTYIRKAATLIVGIAVASGGFFAAPQKAEAAWPVADWLNTTFHAISSAANNSLVVKEYGLDSVGWLVAKVAIQSITKSMVNWINSGFHGSPAFVTDMQSNFQILGDTVANDFVFQLRNELAINSPFRDVIADVTAARYYAATARNSYFIQNPYTLSAYSPNDRAFLAGDFSQGGWGAWFQAISNPANNPYGAQMLAERELNSRIGVTIARREIELDWARGFMSWRGECTAGGGSSTQNITQGSNGTSVQNADGTYTFTGVGEATGDTVALTTTDPCYQSEIQTPGSVIEGQLQKVFGSGIDQLGIADELNEVVGALMGQLMNQVMGGGGLSGLSQPTAGGGRSYIDQAADPSQYNATGSSISGNLGSTVTDLIAKVGDYKAAWERIGAAAQAASSRCSGSLVQSTLASASAAATKASNSLAALNKLQTEIQAAQKSTKDQTSALLAISTEYEKLLSSGTLPSPSEMSTALTESQDTSDKINGETSGVQSLYTKMTQIANGTLSCQ